VHLHLSLIDTFHFVVGMHLDAEGEAHCRQQLVFVHCAVTLRRFMLDAVGYLPQLDNGHLT
jgi:hypothetical protein